MKAERPTGLTWKNENTVHLKTEEKGMKLRGLSQEEKAGEGDSWVPRAEEGNRRR